MDIFDKCFNYNEDKKLIEAGYYPYFITMEKNESAEAVYQGRRLVMCGSNNFLGLSTHPRVQQAAIDAIKYQGTSCTGSRFLNGTLELHDKLEAELAKWLGTESALVFSTGMQANLGAISALVGRGEYAILDKEAHASIIDGSRLSWGNIRRFRHNDPNHLEHMLKTIPKDKGKLVIIDGLYSMAGDVAPLPDIVFLCKKYDARLMIDDAHATGVLGGGRGTPTHFNVVNDVDVLMSTFSKSFASLGGFIAAKKEVINYIKHNGRSLIFSASIPAPNAAAALAALEVMQDEPELIERVVQISKYMKKEIQGLGFNVGDAYAAIIPIIIGDDERTLRLWRELFDAGVYINPILHPAVPQGKQLLRASFMATHTDEQLDKVLNTLEYAGKKIGII